MIRVLIIGLGSIAKKHITALRSLNEEFEIFALRSSLDASKYEDVINIFNLDDTVFDFAIISNPTHLHFKYIKLLASKSIPLFIEKPVVHSLSKINELSEVIIAKNVVTYVACNLRFHPCIIYFRNKIKNDLERVNEVNVYCGSYLPEWRPHVNFREIYSANSKMGGGVHLDLFHELDYTTWLFGIPKKSSSFFRSSSSLEIDAIDYANYLLEYGSFTANIILNYYRKEPKRQIEILTENETFIIDLIRNEIKNDKGELIYSDLNFEIKDTYFHQLNYFINCLKSQETPMNSFFSSIEILKICLNND